MNGWPGLVALNHRHADFQSAAGLPKWATRLPGGRLIEGERMSDLCREFEISRKTGYKIYSPVQGLRG